MAFVYVDYNKHCVIYVQQLQTAVVYFLALTKRTAVYLPKMQHHHNLQFI